MGDDDPDTVLISSVNLGGVPHVTVNGIQLEPGVKASEVTSIFADLGSGRDTMDLSTLDLVMFSGLTDRSIEIRGGAGPDTLVGTSLADVMFGGPGPDTLSGGDGDDDLRGGGGNDRLFGEAGNDTLRGQRGDDSLFGGDDNDRLLGNDGNDFLAGGRGNDGYVFPNPDDTGIDTIDELPGEGRDRVNVRRLGVIAPVNLSSTEVQPLTAGQSLQFAIADTVEKVLTENVTPHGSEGIFTVPGEPGEAGCRR